MLEEALTNLEREVLTWPGVVRERKERGPGGIGVTIYRLGQSQIGHVHDDGQADFLVPRAVREELVRTGRATPHPEFPEEQTAATFRLHGLTDVQYAVEVFRLNYERLRGALTQAEAKRRHRSVAPERVADEGGDRP